ncbi:MAG: hypothetical protein CL609_23740 [Anaerolineaceae bacterium]|nr:hypothetical protein [Anaerolineaceae bacterium]
MNTKRLVKSVLLVLVLLVVFVVPVFAQASGPPDTSTVSVETVSDSIFGALAVIIALAFLVETLVEALFGRIADQIPTLAVYKWLLIYIAVLVGVLGAFVYQFDLIYLLSIYMLSPVPKTMFGIVITGVSIGMGAGYLHQFVSKYFPQQS